MTATWISPWSGEQLAADDLIREVALDALSQLYLVSMLGFPTPDLSLGPDSVVVKSNAIDYEYVIPYPCALAECMACGFSDALLSLRKQYGFLDGARDPDDPRGEAIGAMLRYFKSLDRLIRIVSAARCWNQRCVLAVHGLPAGQSADSLSSDLNEAGFHYLLIYPAADERGSGHFLSIDMAAAIRLVNSLWTRKSAAVASWFDLDRDYGTYRWMSDDSTWYAEKPAAVDELQTDDSS